MLGFQCQALILITKLLNHHLLSDNYQTFHWISIDLLQASQASAAGAGTASRFVRQGIFGTRAPIQTTTDDTPDFDRSKVKHFLFIEL